MKKETTNRGFDIYNFEDIYGDKCSLQESSLATKNAIWFGITNPNPKIFPGNNTGWHDYTLPENVQVSTRMHLDRKLVLKLLPKLIRFVLTGRI